MSVSSRTISLIVPVGDGAGTLTLPCAVEGGKVTRTMGLGGDELVVRVRASAWPLPGGPTAGGGVNFRRAFALVFSRTRPGGLPDESITLGHYYLRQADAEMVVADSAGTAAGAVLNEKLVRLRFVTLPGYYRGDGRGAMLRHRTYNPVKSSGEADTASPHYRTNVQLLNFCMTALGFSLFASPITLDDTPPPAPLDWGNANALHELEALLERCGHAFCLPNNGASIKVVELPKRADTITLDADVTANLAAPFKPARAPGIRSDTIVVHSGDTRTTVLSYRDLQALEWVWYDEAGHAWKNAADTAAGEIKPDEIAAFRAGPAPGSDALSESRRAQYSRLFRALRLKKGGPDDGLRLIAAWEPVTFNDGTKLGSAAAYVKARCSALVGPEVLVRVPVDLTRPRTDVGVCGVGPEAGVFVLPESFLYVKAKAAVPNGAAFGRGDTEALGTALDGSSDLRVYFAHEADFADYLDGGPLWGGFTINYFVAAWRVTFPGGLLTLTELTNADLDAAIADPLSVKVAAPFLKRLVKFDPGDATPVDVNLAALKTAALSVARRRASTALAEAGVAVLKGWINKEPGDCGGAASSITWDLDGFRTEIVLNDHETPDGELDQRALDANRSFAAGVNRFALPGSAVDLSDIRSSVVPGMAMTPAALAGGAGGGGGGGGGGNHPESAAASRGQEALFNAGSSAHHLPGNDWSRQGDTGRFLAQITAAAPLGGNRWSYSYAQVRVVSSGAGMGTVELVSGGRTNLTHGPAVNLAEADNDGAGVEGNGVNISNLPSGWALLPIPVGAVVIMEFNVRDLSAGCVVFTRDNAVDGQCPGTGGSLRGVPDGNAAVMLACLLTNEAGEVVIDDSGRPVYAAGAEVLSDSDRAALDAIAVNQDGTFIVNPQGSLLLLGENAGVPVSEASAAVIGLIMTNQNGSPVTSQTGEVITA